MRKILTPLQKALTNAVQVSVPTFRDAAAYKMPYGMHKGKVLDEIPLLYLDWLRGERGEVGTDPLDLAIRTYLDDPTIQKELADEH